MNPLEHRILGLWKRGRDTWDIAQDQEVVSELPRMSVAEREAVAVRVIHVERTRRIKRAAA